MIVAGDGTVDSLSVNQSREGQRQQIVRQWTPCEAVTNAIGRCIVGVLLHVDEIRLAAESTFGIVTFEGMMNVLLGKCKEQVETWGVPAQVQIVGVMGRGAQIGIAFRSHARQYERGVVAQLGYGGCVGPGRTGKLQAGLLVGVVGEDQLRHERPLRRVGVVVGCMHLCDTRAYAVHQTAQPSAELGIETMGGAGRTVAVVLEVGKYVAEGGL